MHKQPSYYLPLVAVFLGLVSNINSAFATRSDVAKEGRWAEQIIDGLIEGEEIWLNDGNDHEFLAILTEPEEATKNAVILVHGIGVHPNWPDVIYPLRVGLPANGWASLSIQMPVLANNSEADAYLPLIEEAPERFNAALTYLRDQGYRRIDIVAHSMGATMSAYYLGQLPGGAVTSFVAIGLGPGIAGSSADNLVTLTKISVPMLDLYGSVDLDSVLDSASSRALAGNKSLQRYDQVVVQGADHFFLGYEQKLLAQVVSWLRADGH